MAVAEGAALVAVPVPEGDEFPLLVFPVVPAPAELLLSPEVVFLLACERLSSATA